MWTSEEKHFHQFFDNAKRDSIATGDRFVPQLSSNGFWCVVDAHLENIIESGLEFRIALSRAKELSEHDNIQQLKPT